MLKNLFNKKNHPQAQALKLISYSELRAFNDEPKVNLTLTQYTAIQNAINNYISEGGSLESGKISRKTHDIQYSVNIAQGNFILSYHLERVNLSDSYVYRKKGDSRPLKIEKHKKPMIYDVGVNLTTGTPLFIKEYKQYPLKNGEALETNAIETKALETKEQQQKQIDLLSNEHKHWVALEKPCLFWTRNNKHYLATTYVDKYDFFEFMQDEQGTAEEALDVYRAIVVKVLALHQKGWIHCDIKCENFIPKRIDGKLQVELIDGATFNRLETADEISEVIGSSVNTNKNWELDFKVGKAKYGIQTDIYGLNTLLTDVVYYVMECTKLDISKDIFEKLDEITKKPINECFNATQLMGFANELTAAIQKNKQTAVENNNNNNKTIPLSNAHCSL